MEEIEKIKAKYIDAEIEKLDSEHNFMDAYVELLKQRVSINLWRRQSKKKLRQIFLNYRKGTLENNPNKCERRKWKLAGYFDE